MGFGPVGRCEIKQKVSMARTILFSLLTWHTQFHARTMPARRQNDGTGRAMLCRFSARPLPYYKKQDVGKRLLGLNRPRLGLFNPRHGLFNPSNLLEKVRLLLKRRCIFDNFLYVEDADIPLNINIMTYIQMPHSHCRPFT